MFLVELIAFSFLDLISKQARLKCRSKRVLVTLYFIDVDTFFCQQRPEIRLQSQAIRLYKYTKIQEPRLQRNYTISRDQKVIYMARHFNHSRK